MLWLKNFSCISESDNCKSCEDLFTMPGMCKTMWDSFPTKVPKQKAILPYGINVPNTSFTKNENNITRIV